MITYCETSIIYILFDAAMREAGAKSQELVGAWHCQHEVLRPAAPLAGFREASCNRLAAASAFRAADHRTVIRITATPDA